MYWLTNTVLVNSTNIETEVLSTLLGGWRWRVKVLISMFIAWLEAYFYLIFFLEGGGKGCISFFSPKSLKWWVGSGV